MVMYKIQLQNNPNIFHVEHIPKFYSLCKDGIYRPSCPVYQSDEIEPTVNHADGKVYDSWSAFKRGAEAKDCMAYKPNEPLPTRKREHKINQKAFDKAFKNAIDQTYGV